MHITKIGHCCLIIKVGGVTLMTDPGAYSEGQGSVTGIDIILITHEHPDHLHLESLKEVLKNNPEAEVITNAGVGAKLDEANIPYTLLQGRDSAVPRGIQLEAFDAPHEEIYEEFGQVQNTGYFIADKLFYPGDAFKDPERPIDILALPVAGPWCTIGDAIRYALKLQPKKAFPVHDGMFIEGRGALAHRLPGEVLPKHGIEFVDMKEGDTKEF
jgi:L-ascorbate metabolism protein UlaG (beta-lactamase superfamily)